MYPPAVVRIQRLAGLRVGPPCADGDAVVEALQETRDILESESVMADLEENVVQRRLVFLTLGRKAQPTHVKTPARASLDMLRG